MLDTANRLMWAMIHNLNGRSIPAAIHDVYLRVHDNSVCAFLFLHKCSCELQEGFWKIHKDVLIGHENECYKVIASSVAYNLACFLQ